MPTLKEEYKDIEVKIEILSSALRVATEVEDVVQISHKRSELRENKNQVAFEMFKRGEV